MGNKTLSGKDKKGILLMMVGLVFVIAMLLMINFFQKAAQVDEQTLCPSSEPELHTIVLIDKSDKWDTDDIGRVERLLKNIYDTVPSSTRLTILSITGKGRQSTDVKLRFDKCNPGSEKECNALYQNCRRIRKRYIESFGSQLTQIVDLLKMPGEASFSPLYETIVQAIDGSKSQNVVMHVVSDLMENGTKFRFYDVVPLVEDIISEYPLARKNNIQVHVHMEERRRHSRALIGAVQSVWEQYFIQQGATVDFERLLITN